MLQMRVYSERSSTANGIVTNVGEDAHPFVNNAGMFVADGMGGGAGVPILRFDERCFDQELLAGMLCDYFQFESDSDVDEFCSYVKENFSSLSNSVMQEFYRNPKSNTLRLKKSGYVGSHALGTAFAATLINLAPNLTLSNLDYTIWKDAVEQFRDTLLERYKNTIDILGAEYAHVNIDKIDYYGTTLAGVFFKENEDSVDACFLNCGDSRSYVWDSDGFRQACDDQGRNGGMTSRFSLGKDAVVDISFEVRNYKKPCSLFCMTDGFYGVFGGKNGFHSSPLYMEGFLMNLLSTQSSIEDAEARLKAVFDARGQIDDSNSMVMAAFGYDTYENLKNAARTRMNYINHMYRLASMPDDFLLVDYKKIVSDLQESSADSIKPLLAEAYYDEQVHLFCLNQINQPSHVGKYLGEVRRIDNNIASFRGDNSEIKKTLYTIVKHNFTDFVDVNDVDQSRFTRFRNSFRGTTLEDAQYYGQEFSDNYSCRTGAIDALVAEISALNSTITGRVDSVLFNVDNPWTKHTEEESLSWVRTTRDYIRDSLRRSQEILTDIADYSRNITSNRDQWQQINITLMNDYLDKGGAITPQVQVDNWISDALIIEDSVVDTTIPSVRLVVISLVKRFQSNLEQIERLNIERTQELERAANNYWNDYSSKDIHLLLRSEMYFVNNQALKQQIIDLLNQNEELTKFERLAATQEEVFGSYISMHLSETSEDKRIDVDKNGWM